MSVAARVGLLITILTGICALARPQSDPIGPSNSRSPRAAAHATTDDENGSALLRPDDPNGTVDLYGNQVSDAIAKYELDAAGDLYELHSPQTEVPRLKSPKS